MTRVTTPSMVDPPTADTSTHDSAILWRPVVLPSEHGGWSLTAEPVLLGLLVAWSTPGLALGVAAMVAFLARTPLKLVLVDRFRHRWLARTRLAATVAAVEIALLAALVIYAWLAAAEPFWVPLAVAAPLVGIELWFDMRSRGRRLIPELAGSVGIGSVATAIALGGGASTTVAWGLWVVVSARSVAAIPYVRTQIMRTRSRPAPNWHSDTAQAVAVAGAVVGWVIGLVPAAAVVAIGVLVVFNLVALRIAPKPAAVIGFQQLVFGVVVIVTTAIAVA